MDWLTNIGIPAEYTALATIVFVVVAAGFAAYSRTLGKREGPPAPKVQEFYAAGSLADMGPVKELVEQTGLLVQQQVRTNIHLEQCAVALGRAADALTKAADAYQEEIEARATEEEVIERAEKLAERMVRQRRRVAPRRIKKPTG